MFRAGDGTVHPTPKLADSQATRMIGTSEFYVPCGQCGECRISKARSWATRAVHEASRWKLSSFITLTYRTPPKNNSLDPEDTRNFIRRLRRHIGPNFKYFLAGEYGEQNDRPHYHALIFGYDFGYSSFRFRGDATLKDTAAYSSIELDSLWCLGHTSVGELTFDSAAYTAQYAVKKINGAPAAAHYNGRHPEFMRQSKRALGLEYAKEYAHEILQHNSVLSNGVEQPIPPYYLKVFEREDYDLTSLRITREEYSAHHTIEKSYRSAVKLDSKFKLKVSKADAFRIRYASDLFHCNVTALKPKEP